MENLGKIGTDKITGFTGTITAVAHYVKSESTYLIQPLCGKNTSEKPKSYWFSEERVNVTK